MIKEETLDFADVLVSIIWASAMQGKIFSNNKHKIFRSRFSSFGEIERFSGRVDAGGLLINGDGFSSFSRMADLEKSYNESNRTLVLEGIHNKWLGWPPLVISKLTSISKRRVACSSYISKNGDIGLGMHKDEWSSIVLQVSGSKIWKFKYGENIETYEILAGDMIAIPYGVPHEVFTEKKSEHYSFIFLN